MATISEGTRGNNMVIELSVEESLNLIAQLSAQIMHAQKFRSGSFTMPAVVEQAGKQLPGMMSFAVVSE